MEEAGNVRPLNEDKRVSSSSSLAHQFKLTVAYNGHRFNGFQRQQQQRKSGQNSKTNNGGHHQKPTKQPPKRPHWESDTGRIQGVPITVQECLEHAILSYIHHCQKQQQQQEHCPNKTVSTTNHLPEFGLNDLGLRFAGRTDKGVHALGQVVTCWIPTHMDASMSSTKTQIQQQEKHDILLGVNSRLPVDISVTQIDGPLSQPLDPRQDATQKQYSYTLKYHRLSQGQPTNGNMRASVHTMRHALLDSPCLWLVPWPLCDDVMVLLARALSGTHDFEHFCHKEARSQYENHNMSVELDFEILSCEENLSNSNIVTARFLARSKGFRRTMVRNLVGFCVQMARAEHCSKLLPLSSMPTSEEESNQWEQLVVPHQATIVAAPASGLCLDFVHFDNP